MFGGGGGGGGGGGVAGEPGHRSAAHGGVPRAEWWRWRRVVAGPCARSRGGAALAGAAGGRLTSGAGEAVVSWEGAGALDPHTMAIYTSLVLTEAQLCHACFWQKYGRGGGNGLQRPWSRARICFFMRIVLYTA
jgi:hypothetical protein